MIPDELQRIYIGVLKHKSRLTVQIQRSNYRDQFEFWLEDWHPYGKPPLYSRIFGPRKFDHKRKELTYDDYEKQLSRC